MNKLLVIPIFGIILLLIDLYVFQAFRVMAKGKPLSRKKATYIVYWGLTAIVFLAFLSYNLLPPSTFPQKFRFFMIVGATVIYFAKLFSVVILFMDDIIRLLKSLFRVFAKKKIIDNEESSKISRSQFLARSAVIAGAIPLVAMTFGIVSGAHDYRIRRQKLRLANLPLSFDGLKIIQISDIHSGSFYNKTAVKGGIDMILSEKPDVIFFTGDLVNDETREVQDYVNIFDKVKAPLGVYSTTGNHDYGNYRVWPSEKAKDQNFKDLIEAHKLLGWDLLMNEHRFLELNGDRIALIGIENWGMGRFPKYGKMDQAYPGTEDAPVKILLSHDPSHWDAEVRTDYPDIDLMLAGHTHGFQFGIEVGGFKWSPSQWIYKQWAGLYQEKNQYLYVNRGYGYIGYPGRIGILPEITVIELQRS